MPADDMANASTRRIARFLAFVACFSLSRSANPSINLPIPPLQWIELTDLISGPSPPGLKYASIGYDSTSQTLLIFGGEANNFPVQQTYLLNVSSLTWTTPNPLSNLASIKPPARSSAIGGSDFAASYRHGYLIIGGLGQNGPLSDAWEYDYNNQFWSEITISPGGPGPRFSAAGGTDFRALPVQDGNAIGPNNTFYLAGGSDGRTVFPLSDVWQFGISGVLSPNNAQNNTFGSWNKVNFANSLPSRVRGASAVMPSARVVSVGGCNTTDGGVDTNESRCAGQDSNVLAISSKSAISPSGCPAPRVGPVVVPNYNGFSSSFSSQVLMMLGTFNASLWDDGNGLSRGEVDVLDIDTGTWARILPAGDPASNPPKFPAPREGATALAYPNALVGPDPSVGSDIIVFGGKDVNGNYLKDVWLLRTYSASLTSSNATWPGFGNGTLQTGVTAGGRGVTIQYMTSCATPRPSDISPGKSPPSVPPSSSFLYDTHVGHKVLSPLSVALLLVSVLLCRISPLKPGSTLIRSGASTWVSFLFCLSAYATGIVGLAIAFTSISLAKAALSKRADVGLNLQTQHGKAGLVLFVATYILLPIWLVTSVVFLSRDANDANQGVSQATDLHHTEDTGPNSFTSTNEKIPIKHRARNSSPDITTQLPIKSEHRSSRTRSLLNGHLWPSYRSKDHRHSTESTEHDSETSSAGPARSFEVLNRGKARIPSVNGISCNGSDVGRPSHPVAPRSLSNLNWLDRRQNVAAYGELDYALSQLTHAQIPAQSLLPGENLTAPALEPPHPRPVFPSKTLSAFHCLLQICVMGLCVVTLVELWKHAPLAGFTVFLVWTVLFYCLLFILAWRGRPKESILAVLMHGIRYYNQMPTAVEARSRPLSTNDPYTLSNDLHNPYTFHRPPYRRVVSMHEELSSLEHGGYRPDDDPDEDEDTQQRRIEQEMDRRDVSIITVPKRRLRVANPS